MHMSKLGAYVLCAVWASFLMVASAAAQQTSVPLGTASTYGVLAGTTITNTGASVITGGVGLSPGTVVTGFPPGTVSGTILTAAAAAGPQADLITAYNDAAGRIPVSTIAAELGGQTLVAGVYDSASGTFEMTGILTLDGQNDPNSVFIFKAASTLTTAAGAPGLPASQVVLIRGAQPCNIFWQVGSSATLGTYSVFQGNILALTSITATTGATLTGRALARNGAVTLDTNAITVPVCSGSIRIVKNAAGGNGTFAFTSNFGLTSLTTVLGTASDTFADLPLGGSYSVTETLPPGWIQTSATCTNGTLAAITVEAGVTTTCTIVNSTVAPPPIGSIRIVKNTVGGNGTFAFTSNFGLTSLTTVLGTASATFGDLTPGGSYSVTETLPPGWIQTSTTCTNGTLAAITVEAGVTTTCTITNTTTPPATGSIKVVKNAVGGNGTFPFISNFGFTSLTTTGGTASQTFDNLVAGGAYRVSEMVPAGWTQTGASCTSGTVAAITVVAGATTTCTFTNTVVPPAVADLTILKSHQGDFRQGDGADTYTLTVSNAGEGPTTGAVTVTDTLPAGLTATAISGPGWSCTLASLTCARSDALAPNATYPVITVTVSVADNGLAFTDVAGSPAFQTGDILLSMADGTVQWRRRDWTLVTTLPGVTGGQAKGMAFDSFGSLFVTHWSGTGSFGNDIAKFDRNGGSVGFFGSGFDCNPSSIVFDNSGNAYVGQADCGAQIRKFDSSGKPLAQYTVAVENRGTSHIVLGSDQCTMYYTSEGANVKRFNVCTNTQMSNFNVAPLPDPAGGAHEFALLPGGGMLVADFSVIARLDAAGNLVRTYDLMANNCWLGLSLDPDGVSFWASNWCASSVTRFAMASGNALTSHVAGDQGFMVKQIAVPGSIFTTTVINTAAVAGGGELNLTNDSASDATTIDPPAPPVPSASNPGGIVNAASYAPAVAAGSIASVFGSNLASGQAVANALPLPTTLASSSIQIGGRGAPLFFASPTQVNVQVPWEVEGQSKTKVTASVGGAVSNQQMLSIASFAPGIFTLNEAGSSQGAVVVAGTALLAAPPTGSGRQPVTAGEFISIYCTGLGAVSNPPATGIAASADPLSVTTTTPRVTIGGIAAHVTFSGLAPGLVGLYQVNVQVPAGAAAGEAVPLVLTIGGIVSNTVTIAVQ